MASAPEHEGSSLLPHNEGEGDHEPKKNFPPCWPILYHDIDCEIGTDTARSTCRFAWWQWYAICAMVILNAAAKCSILVAEHGFFTFVDIALSLIYIIIIPLYSAWTYSFLYCGLRDRKSSSLMFFFCLYAILVIAMIIFGVGVSRSGGAFCLSGILGCASLFESSHHICAILHLVSALAWGALVLWSVGVGWSVQRRYSEMGGTETTAHEAQEAAAAAAYANREQLASAAYRASLYNKEQPDPIAQTAWENREIIAQVAYENREAIAAGAKVAATAAYENRQAIAAGAKAASEVVDARSLLLEPPPPRPVKK